METRKYPYTAWRLNQLGKPTRVTLYGSVGTPGRFTDKADYARKGRVYLLSELYSSYEEAVNQSKLE